MTHFVLFHWILIQIFIAHAASQIVVRGVTGQSVRLPCDYQVTRRTGLSDVCWGRGSCPNSKCKNMILETRGRTVRSRKSRRYDLQGSISTGDVSLTIGMVEAGDAGIYCCRVEIPGWFNDIKKNIRLVVARAPPVMTTTTRKAPVSPKGFRKTTFAPQATSVLQPTAQTAVLLTTTTTELAAVTTLETTAPPTIPVTENDAFPVTMVTTSALPHPSTISHEDDMFCVTVPGPVPGRTEVTTEFPNILLTEEGSTSADPSVMMEDVPNTGISANSDGKAEQHDDSGDKLIEPKPENIPSVLDTSEKTHPPDTPVREAEFPISVILIACVIAGAVLFALMFSLFWKRKHVKKHIIKRGPHQFCCSDCGTGMGEVQIHDTVCYLCLEFTRASCELVNPCNSCADPHSQGCADPCSLCIELGTSILHIPATPAHAPPNQAQGSCRSICTRQLKNNNYYKIHECPPCSGHQPSSSSC